jgi:homoserine kinase
VRVPCSTSNLGAGFDTLGLAFERFLDAEYLPAPGPLHIVRTGTLADLRVPLDDDCLVRALRSGLRARGVSDVSGLLRVHSEIPVARGLGSSAAATVAGLSLGTLMLGEALDRGALLAQATDLEGHPDNAAPALYGGLIAVARDEAGVPRAFLLPLAPEVGFVFAAPDLEISTAAARAALPATVPHAAAARMLGRMAALVRGLQTRDVELIRLGMLDELHVPHRLPLIADAERALEAAHAAGAWGATISGAGSGLLALCEHGSEEAILAALLGVLGERASGFVATPDLYGVRELPVEF